MSIYQSGQDLVLFFTLCQSQEFPEREKINFEFQTSEVLKFSDFEQGWNGFFVSNALIIQDFKILEEFWGILQKVGFECNVKNRHRTRFFKIVKILFKKSVQWLKSKESHLWKKFRNCPWKYWCKICNFQILKLAKINSEVLQFEYQSSKSENL